MTKIRGVILDVDGTLIDSNDAHAHAWQDALREHGYDMTFEEIRRLIGMGGDNFLPTLIDVEKESAQGRQIEARRSALFQLRYLSTLQAFPQVRELLLTLRESGLELIVGTSAKKQEVEKLLEIADVQDLIQTIISADDAEHSKPAPDIVQVALDKAGMSAEQMIMLGDAPYDIQSAERAGVPVIALRCGGFNDADLAGAIAIYNDPADLLATYDRSPFVDTRIETQ